MLNKSTLEGRMTRDPELKYVGVTGEEKLLANITIACERPGKNKVVDFIPVTLWGTQAKYCCDYAKKGDLVSITARIQMRSYETKDGAKRTVMELVADTYDGFRILAKASSKAKQEDVQYDPTDYQNNDFNSPNNSASSDFNSFGESNTGDFSSAFASMDFNSAF